MEPSSEALLRRLEALESEVQTLRKEVKRLSSRPGEAAAGSGSGAPTPDRVTVVESPRTKATRSTAPAKSLAERFPWTTEDVMKWAGIALVLFSVAFFFKYAVDQGWLTPTVRVILGLLLGFVLLFLGVLLRVRRPGFGHVLQGGAVATFYITLFAAFQVMSLVPFGMAFGGMVLVTALALALGLWQKDPALAVFGLIGGLATPFLLYTDTGDITGLVTYVLLLLAATTGIYLFWGWRSMLYTTVIGGWIVLFIASNALPAEAAAQVGDRWAVQVGALFGLAAFWVTPVVRELLVRKNPSYWPTPTLTAKSAFVKLLERVLHNAPHQLTLVTPLIAFGLSASVWDLPSRTWGFIALVAAALFLGLAELLRRADFSRMAYTHRWSSLLLTTLAIPLILREEGILVVFAAEATALHFLSQRLEDRLLRASAHALWLVPGIWLLFVAAEVSSTAPVVVNLASLRILFVIVCLGSASLALNNRTLRIFYLGAAHAAALAWVFRELSWLEAGQAYVTIVWTLYAVTLLLVGLRFDQAIVRTGGLVTFAIVVGKLFLVDLDQLDPLWRILLFLGIGALFLVIGYFLPSLWKELMGRRE